LFSVFDKDGNGLVDFGEFASSLSVLLNGSYYDQILFAFRLLDANGDGSITLSEMLHYFKTYLLSQQRMLQQPVNPERWNLIESHLRRGFAVADLDKNGTISLDEFERAIRNPDHPLTVILDNHQSFKY